MNAVTPQNFAEAAGKAPAVAKQRRISPRVREACELLADGTAKTIVGAAEMVGLSREHLGKQLKKDHVQGYLTREAKRKVSQAVYRAAHVKVGLLEAESERVRSDVASELLAIQGIKPVDTSRGPTVNVNVQPGYVIRLRDGEDARDITPAQPDQPSSDTQLAQSEPKPLINHDGPALDEGGE